MAVEGLGLALSSLGLALQVLDTFNKYTDHLHDCSQLVLTIRAELVGSEKERERWKSLLETVMDALAKRHYRPTPALETAINDYQSSLQKLVNYMGSDASKSPPSDPNASLNFWQHLQRVIDRQLQYRDKDPLTEVLDELRRRNEDAYKAWYHLYTTSCNVSLDRIHVVLRSISDTQQNQIRQPHKNLIFSTFFSDNLFNISEVDLRGVPDLYDKILAFNTSQKTIDDLEEEMARQGRSWVTRQLVILDQNISVDRLIETQDRLLHLAGAVTPKDGSQVYQSMFQGLVHDIAVATEHVTKNLTVAFWGPISAGKSTLLNALIGYPILPTNGV